MSLYRLCPWWTAQCPDTGPNYDAASMHSAILNDDGGELLLVGSHSGYLSIFLPHQQSPTTSSNNNNAAASNANKDDDVDDAGEFHVAMVVEQQQPQRPVDLVLEVKLDQPILAVSSAAAVASTSNNARQILILHPMAVCVYALCSSTADVAAVHNAASLELCVAHRLNHAAYSLCHGYFGRTLAQGAEFLAVMHMNGTTITFFEQNGIAYECKLTGAGNSTTVGIPSQLVYVPRIDGFVLMNGAATLECFRYQDASECAENDRTMEPIWRCCVGEFALDLAVVRTGVEDSVIAILGENNLMCISDTGCMLFIKRLDYTPICFYTFLNAPETDPKARLMTAIVTAGGFVQLYADTMLAWCWQLSQSDHASTGANPSDGVPQLDDAPVSVRRAQLRQLPGAFVTLGANGQLSVGYLGTRPQPHQVPVLPADRVVDVPRARLALAELETEIDRTLRLTGDAAVQSTLIDRELHVQLLPVGRIVEVSRGGGRQCEVAVLLKARPEHRVDQVQVHFVVCAPLQCSAPLHVFGNLVRVADEDQGPAAVRAATLVVWPAAATAAPASLHVTAIVSFINAHSVFRVAKRRLRLPLEMFAKLCAPVKTDAAIKLTLGVEDNGRTDGGIGGAPTLAALLATHFGGGRLDATAQAIGIRALGSNESIATKTPVDAIGEDGAASLTIVSAKSSNRYRLQCSDVTSLLPMVLDVIIGRLLSDEQQAQPSSSTPGGSARGSAGGRRITLRASMSLAELSTAIGAHHEQCERLAERQLVLTRSIAQMRIILRRLFVKLDDKKPPNRNSPAGGNAAGGGATLDGVQMLFRLTLAQLERNVRGVQDSKVATQQTRDNLTAWLTLMQHIVRYAPDVPTQRRDGLLAVLCQGSMAVRDWQEKNWAEIVQPAVDLLRQADSLNIKDHDAFVFGQSGEHGPGAGAKFDIKKLQSHWMELLEPICRAPKASTTAPGDPETIVEDTDRVDENAQQTTENEWSSNGAAEHIWQL